MRVGFLTGSSWLHGALYPSSMVVMSNQSWKILPPIPTMAKTASDSSADLCRPPPLVAATGQTYPVSSLNSTEAKVMAPEFLHGKGGRLYSLIVQMFGSPFACCVAWWLREWIVNVLSLPWTQTCQVNLGKLVSTFLASFIQDHDTTFPYRMKIMQRQCSVVRQGTQFSMSDALGSIPAKLHKGSLMDGDVKDFDISSLKTTSGQSRLYELRWTSGVTLYKLPPRVHRSSICKVL